MAAALTSTWQAPCDLSLSSIAWSSSEAQKMPEDLKVFQEGTQQGAAVAVQSFQEKQVN